MQKGGDLKAWLASPQVAPLLQSELGRGLVSEVQRIGKVRAEDLKIEGMKGLFLEPVVEELITAKSALHYDYTYGRQEIVRSVPRTEVPILSRVLPLLLRATTQERFRVPGLPEIYSVHFGDQRLLVTELEGSIYAGVGLKALMNVLNQAPLSEPNLGQLSAPVEHFPTITVRVRGEAFFNSLMPVLVGSRHSRDLPFKVTSTAELLPVRSIQWR